jgi:hypothetical protein
MRTPPPNAAVPTIIDGRDEMTQATYERTMICSSDSGWWPGRSSFERQATDDRAGASY